MKKRITTMAVALVAATAVRAEVLASWDNNSLAGGATTAPVGTELAGVSAGDLSYVGYTAGTSPNTLQGRYNGTGTLAEEIAAKRYFTVTITPDAGKSINFDTVGFEGTISDWTGETGVNDIQVALLSSLTGWTDGNVIGTADLPENTPNGGHYYDQIIDVSGIEALDTVTTAVEFRFYVLDQGDPSTMLSFGHANYTGANPGTQDLEFNGTVSQIPEPASLGLLVFFSAGMLWIRRKLMI